MGIHKKNDVESISSILKKGLEELFSEQRFKDYLKMLSYFPNYSAANIVLILRQCPHARMVRTFPGWIKLGRVPNQPGIRIRAPRKRHETGKDNQQNKEDEEVEFRTMTVFDISQTVPLDGGEEQDYKLPPSVRIVGHPVVPMLLVGDIEGYQDLMAVLHTISPFPIRFEVFSSKEKKLGETRLRTKEIVIKEGMSQLQTIKTTIHEVAHALLHTINTDRNQREIESESIAFIVCQRLGLDTSDYSFSYIANYSLGRKKRDVNDFLDTIQETASYLIDSIEGELEALRLPYREEGFVMLVNNMTAYRLYQQHLPVYLVYPEKGELMVTDRKQIWEHTGPYAVENKIWRRDAYAA